MVEMRWVEREQQVQGTTAARMVRVLQYRYYKMHEISEGTFMHHLADWAMEWTPWMDVPVEEE